MCLSPEASYIFIFFPSLHPSNFVHSRDTRTAFKSMKNANYSMARSGDIDNEPLSIQGRPGANVTCE